MSIEAKQATPNYQLIAELLDSRIPKTEREHAAAREVEKLRQAIAEADQAEPVAWRTFDGEGNYEYCTYEMNENYAKEWAKRNPNHADWVDPLYAHPPARKPLTDEEIEDICWTEVDQRLRSFARAIERAHGIGG